MGYTVKKVTVLGLHNSMASTIFGPMDIFNQAGRIWNRVTKVPSTPYFEVTLASPDGEPFQATNNILIQPHCGVEAIEKTDLIMIASATFIKQIKKQSPGLIPWLKRQYARGAHIASVCTGVFLLAETGLLDDKSATLHWGYGHMFRQYYPNVKMETDRMFLDHGRLYCSAGVNAGMDLSLYLVEKFCGRQVAVQCAKTMVLDLGRTAQTPYGSFLYPGDHRDPVIMEIQNWIQQNHAQPIDYDQLANRFRLSRRSLERRFKSATNHTPLSYVQELRVETAKRLLEEGNHTFSEITYMVGYEDISYFRKLFVRLTGLRPREYQHRFAGYGVGTAHD